MKCPGHFSRRLRLQSFLPAQTVRTDVVLCSPAAKPDTGPGRGLHSQIPSHRQMTLPDSLWIAEMNIDKSEQESYNCS